MKLCPHCNQPLDWKNYCASCDKKIGAFESAAGGASYSGTSSNRDNGQRAPKPAPSKPSYSKPSGGRGASKATSIAVAMTVMMVSVFAIVAGYMSGRSDEGIKIPKVEIPSFSLDVPDYSAIMDNIKDNVSQAQDAQAHIQEIMDEMNQKTQAAQSHKLWKTMIDLPYRESDGTEGNMTYYYDPDVIRQAKVECEFYHMNTSLTTIENTMNTLSLGKEMSVYDDGGYYDCYYQDFGDSYFCYFSDMKTYLLEDYGLAADYDPGSERLHNLIMRYDNANTFYTAFAGVMHICGGMNGWSYPQVLETLLTAQDAIRTSTVDGMSDTHWFYLDEKLAACLYLYNDNYFIEIYPRSYYDDLMGTGLIYVVPKTE